MTAEEYKKKLITYLEHNIKLWKANREIEYENYKRYLEHNKFDEAIDSRCKSYGADQRIAYNKNLIADIKDGTIEMIMEESV